MRLIERVWFDGHKAKWLLVPILLPLSALFWLVISIRRFCYQMGIKKSSKVSSPVVIVGNIGIGGNGKTPLTLFLIEQLMQRGIKVGVVSRGYGGQAPYYPFQLSETATADQVGDEPLLIYQRTGVDVVVGPDRVAAAKRLVELGCEIVIADDGLQHYRLARDYEFIVVDGRRTFGNKLLLPSGPMRETCARLASVNCVVVNGELEGDLNVPFHHMNLLAQRITNVATGESMSVTNFKQQHTKVNAIAGIGDPKRFFTTLINNNFELAAERGFVDHQTYTESMFTEFDESLPLVMTEKDAVKCTSFAKKHWWYLTVDATFTDHSKDRIIHDILKLINH